MDESPKNNNPIPEKDVPKDFKTIWQDIKHFFTELLDIHSETDRDSTIEAVRKDIPFKGHNAWILIFSIFIASIGLNVGSTAVVIGAMLISPLMGPIVGVGLSVAINDLETLKKSLVNLLVMVVLSVVTAFIYFQISPIDELTPELASRTYPTILDVLVAIFGGLALIVAKTKKGTIASVIFGVAIATALMPPLCTVGYGLAVSEPKYWLGALYLFSINAVFIALSTFVVAKILRFPLVRYADSKRRRTISQLASIIAVIVMVPSIYLFYKLYQQQVFKTSTKNFVEENIKFEGAEVVKFSQDYHLKKIDVYLIGNLVPQDKINSWYRALKEDQGIADVNLKIHQGSDRSSELASQLSSQVKSGILEDLYVNNQQALTSKDEQIRLLEGQINKMRNSAIPFESLSREVKINYEDLDRFGYANTQSTNFKKQDTIPTFLVRWKKGLKKTSQITQEKKLGSWLKIKYGLDTLVVRSE